ncbi:MULTISPECIES: IlvD/Edd family dehydratase [Sphingobium]|jgi:dihydroxy-acid dehydratase|uniref:Dihydroxy-acid dehydratase n=1 Tax=Sphingobium fuliginis (strain ATCC 27551) TaxID=336203 RepID=A0A292ZFG5_SPHSA|nr:MULTISPECIES: IlvD/Edd family dehydratase [Sphingobium]QOT72434.1 dihydroxy-acid dehydratase family protein [Sphingobium fuliginis]GAY21631.1 dihydroxy-acid dehydratase [Sphingobium fuliginis]
MSGGGKSGEEHRLRSRQWFDNAEDPVLASLYTERYLNFGLTPEELQSGRPIIGIAQTGSDLSPCNRSHLELAQRVKDGIRESGGIPLEFPVHPIQETGRRPTAAIDRNLAYVGLVETLHGYPLDGVVLTTGCDKTTPACIMAAATANIPAMVLTNGPMLNGWYRGERAGAVSIAWKLRAEHAAGRISEGEMRKAIMDGATSAGYCNTMGTASTMNALAEVLGLSLPGSGTIPAAYRERGAAAYRTGRRIVELVRQNIRPSDILTREAFENAVVVNTALGGSSNAPVHIIAIARHVGVDFGIADWERGHDVPLLVNMQPAGAYLAEDFHRAGGVPAVVAELMRMGRIHEGTLTVNGSTLGENCRNAVAIESDVIRTAETALRRNAGFIVLRGNLFASAIMKLSVITSEFRDRYLTDPDDPDAFEGTAVLFEGPEDFRKRIDDPASGIDESSILVMRGAGPVGYPGAPEVVNMRPPAALVKRGISVLPCIGDGRQSGTSASPSILNASPEAASGGNLALVRSGDRIRIDLRRRRADLLVEQAELTRRRDALEAAGGFPMPRAQTPWQEIQRELVDQLSDGMVIGRATRYRNVSALSDLPRHPV